jgi:hypothetical protein
MTAEDVLAACRSRGVELSAAGDRLRFRAPVGAVDADLRSALAEYKAKLVAVIVAACPLCRRPTDAKRRCWSCHNRSCEVCGAGTGSAFIATCIRCDLSDIEGT